MAKSSALEKAVADIGVSLALWIRTHDRMVVMALMLSLVPVPPACWFGLLLSIGNFTLLKLERLPKSEARTVYVTLLIGLITSILGIFLMGAVMALVTDSPFGVFFNYMPGFIQEYLQNLLWFMESIFGRNDSPGKWA